jgi:hypothetical protein
MTRSQCRTSVLQAAAAAADIFTGEYYTMEETILNFGSLLRCAIQTYENNKITYFNC